MATLPDAYLLAKDRGILPTALGTAALRKEFTAAVRARAVFSARTAYAPYLQVMQNVVNDLLRGETADGASFTHPEGRLRLKQAMVRFGYNPETGFGTEAEKEIPPAEAGSLRDLSSDRRLNLILDTQARLFKAEGQKQRGLEAGALALFPAWELLPSVARERRFDWPRRWAQAGGKLLGGRLIAHKLSPVWAALGNGSTFPDALDTDRPPFAFGSKRYWKAIGRDEWRQLGGEDPEGGADDAAGAAGTKGPKGPPPMPAPVASVGGGVSPELKARLAAILKAKQAAGGNLTYSAILERELKGGKR